MGIIAIVVAIVSLSVAMLTLGWTIYRDVIQKPRFRVSVALKSVYQAGHEPVGPNIFVEALNLGPLPNRLGVVYVRKSWWQRRINPNQSLAFINSDFTHMAATPAGTRLEVGDIGTFVFPYDRDWASKTEFDSIGVQDGYGRWHWAPRAQMQKVSEKYSEDFGEGTDGN